MIELYCLKAAIPTLGPDHRPMRAVHILAALSKLG